MLRIELVVSPGNRCFHVTEHGVDPGEHFITHGGITATGNDGAVKAAGIFNTPKTGQTITDDPGPFFQSMFRLLLNG